VVKACDEIKVHVGVAVGEIRALVGVHVDVALGGIDVNVCIKAFASIICVSYYLCFYHRIERANQPCFCQLIFETLGHLLTICVDIDVREILCAVG
jgi:hypothetical protein